MRRIPRPLVLALGLAACARPSAPSSGPPPATPPPTPVVASPTPATSPDPSFSILIRPIADPSPSVHVEIELEEARAADLTRWRLAIGSPERLTHVSAHDVTGALSVDTRTLGTGPAMGLTLERVPRGRVHLEYDVLAGGDAPDDPVGIVVHGYRFRGSGERLIAIPESIDDETLRVAVEIDLGPLQAEKAASSLGVGTVRRSRLRLHSLLYAGFLAGSNGDAVLDAPEGHDEASWVGYPAFDPRAAVVELAQVRTALARVLGARDLLPGPPWTYLLDVSGSRPEGVFSVTPRLDGMLLQVSSREPWAAPLRLSLAQMLARRWVGDALRLTPPAGHEADVGWFNDGVARYLATRLLAQLEVLTPKDWAEAIVQELSALATSPYAGQDSVVVSARAPDDPIARVTMMMRGALYAAREAAVIEAHTKGARNLESVLVSLLELSRNASRDGTTHALPLSSWFEALSKDDPDAAKAFDEIVSRGKPVSLPSGALGPCFRAGTGEYVAFDAGFDVEATRQAADRAIVGLRAGGPGASAGLAAGDIVESLEVRDGDASAPVKLEITRAGRKVALSYLPRGARGRGQTWARVPGVAESRCGLPP